MLPLAPSIVGRGTPTMEAEKLKPWEVTNWLNSGCEKTFFAANTRSNMIFRTDAQKRDLVGSWRRFDRAFFASGACHVLAHEFLKRPEADGFRALMFEPDPGFRGGHVFASNGRWVFDYHGWSSHPKFVDHYLGKISQIIPGWSGKVADISRDFWSEAWFARSGSRRLAQFHLDPTERANAVIDRVLARRRREFDVGSLGVWHRVT